MGSSTVVSQPSVIASGKNAESKRAFEDVWATLERRHAWKISEVEIQNPPIAISKLPYAWQDYTSKRAEEFRIKHKLDELIAGCANDWQAVLRIRHWAHTRVIFGQPHIASQDPFDILHTGQAGGTLYCTYLAYLFVGAASSLGFTARHLGIDSDHGPDQSSSHHGIADVWVNHYRKWVAIDPTFDCHYELNGIPLSAEEIGQCWQKNQGLGVKARIGVDEREVPRASRASRMDVSETCRYFWHYIDCENDVFHKRNQSWPNPVVFPVDAARKAKVWYQGKPPESYKHARYADGSFLTTERTADAYPDLNCTLLTVDGPRATIPYCCHVGFGHCCTPNFLHREIRVDGGNAEIIECPEFPWALHPGECSIEVRAVNAAGHRGPPSRIRIRIENDPARKADWPGSL